uniref:CBS domain-containing protein n=1 Tax=Oncorhynchus tshawytscha TaxID=74940 RepID=A0A8C8M8G0_ONCTS
RDADAEMYMKFMKSHCCYETIPTSCKLVIFDTTLQVRVQFFPFPCSNILCAAPSFLALSLSLSLSIVLTGMLTITDFINILHHYYRSPLVQMNELERHQIGTWRGESFKFQNVYLQYSNHCLHSITPDASLFDAIYSLLRYKIHRLPVIDPVSGNTVPKPCFMQKTIQDVGIGTFRNIATVQQTASVYDALSLFVERTVSALPVVNDKVVALYSRFDVIKTYNNLNMSMEEAIRRRCCFVEGVTVIDRIIKAEVHRLVLVDKEDVCRGIISLSDLLQAVVLTPAGNDTL